MKQLLFILLLILCSKIGYSQANGNNINTAGIEKLESIADLGLYKGDAQLIFVINTNDGGIFYYTIEKHTIDNGIVFQGKNKGYWVRMFEVANGVDLAWFGAKMDSITDDGDAVKRALVNNYVKIRGVVALSGKTVLPEGKTIEFLLGGAIKVLDTFQLKINSFVKATDYQQIIKGNGKVVFGSNSVPYISACWFGAVSNCYGFTHGGGTDNTVAINNAINAAVNVSDVYLPPAPANSSYRITSTIKITKKLHFFSFRFHGGGTSFTNNGSDRASNIFADFNAGSAINVQGSRRVYVTDLGLQGINYEPKNLSGWGNRNNRTDSVNNPATFLSKGVNINYAAVTTDAEKESKIWSADIQFERLQIQNFSIGIGISQAGNYQGDRMRVENTQINQCVYGISIGQAQSRADHFSNVDMNRVWCGITNNTFGDRTGSEFQVTGGQWCNLYKCFIMQPSYMGQSVITGLYTESVGAIGTIGDHNANNYSVVFTGCEFFMMDYAINNDRAFAPPFYTLWTYGNVTFEGCSFWTAKHNIAFYAGEVEGGFTGSTITMNGCSFHHMNTVHIKGNSLIENTFLIPNSSLLNYNRSILVDFESNKRYNTSYTPVVAISGMELSKGGEKTITSNKHIVRKIPRFYVVEDAKEHISNVNLIHDTLHFSYDEQLKNTFFRYVFPSDAIGTTLKEQKVTQWDNPAFEILVNDTNKQEITAITQTANFTFDKIALYTNCFFTIQPITGLVTTGSDIIRGVSNINRLHIGDFITFKEANRAYRISKIDTTDGTLTLMDEVKEKFSGQTLLYNELLTDDNSLNNGSSTSNIITITESKMLTSNDNTIIVKGGATAIDITLELPVNIPKGHIFNIKKSTGSGKVIILPVEGTIDGMKNYIISEENNSISVQFDGENYYIISK